jgi:Xaa-Pro aminopeptidase
MAAATRKFLRFETLTLAPFDRNLIDAALLDPWELDWLNTYHARVLREVGPNVEAHVRTWLTAACASIG